MVFGLTEYMSPDKNFNILILRVWKYSQCKVHLTKEGDAILTLKVLNF